jgi:Flp pilus assembly CpaE family ATPase
VALNLAAVLARSFAGRVALLDLAAPFSHALLAAGLESFTTLADVPPQWLDCLDISMISNALSAHPSGFAVLPAASGAEQSEAVNGAYVKAALKVLRRHYDAVIVDCATTLNDATVAAMSEGDEVLVVAEPRVHAVADLARVKRTLEESVLIPTERVSFVLNHRAPASQVSRQQVEEALAISLIAELPHGGREAYEAFEQGEVLAVKSPRSALARAIEQLVTRIQPREVKQPIRFEQRRTGSLLQRLKRAS